MDPAPLKKYGRTPLYIAAANGHIEIFKDLMKRKEEVEPDEFGMLPIHAAAMGGHVEIAKLCPKTQFDALTKEQKSPLWLAAQNGNVELVDYLIGETRETEAKAQDLTAKKGA